MIRNHWLRLIRKNVFTVSITPRQPPSRSSFLSRQYSSQYNHNHNYNSYRSFIPLLFSYPPLLLQSTSSSNDSDATPPSPGPAHLRDIIASVPHPDSSEFLIAANSSPSLPPTFFGRLLTFLRRYFIEPVSTTRRFIHLALLFLPVILTSPVLLLEAVDQGSLIKKRSKMGGGEEADEEERVSTKWWYEFLVGQMQRAGPTFIKVCLSVLFSLLFVQVY